MSSSRLVSVRSGLPLAGGAGTGASERHLQSIWNDGEVRFVLVLALDRLRELVPNRIQAFEIRIGLPNQVLRRQNLDIATRARRIKLVKKPASDRAENDRVDGLTREHRIVLPIVLQEIGAVQQERTWGHGWLDGLARIVLNSENLEKVAESFEHRGDTDFRAVRLRDSVNLPIWETGPLARDHRESIKIELLGRRSDVANLGNQLRKFRQVDTLCGVAQREVGDVSKELREGRVP